MLDKLTLPRKVYAVWNTDESERRLCASAGVGTLLAMYVVEKEHGVAFGSRYEYDGYVRVRSAKSKEDVKRFRGSKYVQSIMDKTLYDEVVSYLATGLRVVFIGTPCQIAMLKNYLLKNYGGDLDGLITVDIICHGTCPPDYLHDEVIFLKEKHNIPNVTDVRFRSNDENDYCLTLWDNGRLLLKSPYYTSFYLKGFLDGITLRECCYTCPFARPERIADITIGDYVGLDSNIAKAHINDGNTSAVFLNTLKGELFFESLLKGCPQLVAIERNYEERLAIAPPLRMPFPKDARRPKFLKYLHQVGYVRAIRKTIFTEIFVLEHPWYSLPLRVILKIKRLFAK